ncbi:glycosyltransferase [Ruegeria arenilitoris]|uniref:glycosyltransferase n=1 Tax=Ruegeria arenilitoris TaxID=1173585 RepID=UPI00147F6070|nr:glycosyltransferase [Ruegeria arenilitoris]
MTTECHILSGNIQTDTVQHDFLSVIIAAHNEEDYIADCLEALLEQDNSAGLVEVIVAANACTDRTEDVVFSMKTAFEERNWRLVLLKISRAGKPNAFNQGDDAAIGNNRIYLDADVRCDPEMLGQLRAALSQQHPIYATGTIQVVPPSTWITKRYAEFWVRLPFVQNGAVGAGLFSANAAGRKRWAQFPAVISDDTFVRLNFAPEERIEVAARYHWPMVEGMRNLVRVRRRQDAGVAEIRRLYPELIRNENAQKISLSNLLHLMVQVPIGFLVYATIQTLVRLRPGSSEWVRGR